MLWLQNIVTAAAAFAIGPTILYLAADKPFFAQLKFVAVQNQLVQPVF